MDRNSNAGLSDMLWFEQLGTLKCHEKAVLVKLGNASVPEGLGSHTWRR